MLTRAEICAAIPDRLRVADAAALCGVSRTVIYHRIRDGLMSSDGGRPATVPKAEALAYLKERMWRGL